MKNRFIVFYALFFTAMTAVVCMSFLCRRKNSDLPMYTTDINRLLMQLSDSWEKISENGPEHIDSDTDFDYAVLDTEGDVLFYTKEDMSLTVSAATGHYDIIRDIEKDGETVGRLIVHNQFEDIKSANDKKAALMICVMCVIMLSFSVGYFIWLRKRVVEPFGKLEGFAERIAEGDLDTPLEMDRENIFGAFTQSFDIMREELKASRLREQAALTSRKEMIAELSHDIKTPVASIKAMTDFLLLVSDDAEQKKTLGSIIVKADNIDKLISNMFHATLEELEQLEVNSEEISSLELAEMFVESDHLKRITTADIKECVIIADTLRLNQIVGNVISNSYKYADTEINVSSYFDSSEFVVEIADKGGGVPDEELELITEKFRRGSNAEGKEGSGIGLYISKYLMTKMGGGLSCYNNREGFTVVLRFRLA